MSLFAVERGRNQMERSSRLSKSERFRLQIRRKQQQQIFKTVRRQFVDSLKCLNFLQELKSQKDNMTAKKINWLIEGLQDGQNNASFYQDISDMQLQSYLCDVILNQEINLQNKTKIMKSLVELTYFSCKIPKQLIENNLIDYFRVELNKMNMTNQFQQNFTFEIASLVLNLTSFRNQSFNYHMIECDFLPVLYKNIERNQQYRGGVVQIRQILLKIYGNLFQSEIKSFTFVANTLRKILCDQKNSQNEDLLCCTLSCLVQAAKMPKFWLELQDYSQQNGQIFGQTINLIDLVHDNFTQTSFNLILDFLIALFEQREPKVTEQTNYFISSVPNDFFFKGLMNLKKNQQNNTKSKQIICRLIKLASKVQTLYKTIYGNNIQRQQFIQCITQKYILSNPISRKYLSRVLTKIITQDKCAIDTLINNGIIDIVRDLLDSQYFKDQKVDVVDLVEALIQAEEDLRDKANGENKIMNVFEDRGIIRDIQKLQDDPSKDVYERAEQFMGRLDKLKQNGAK